MNTIFSLAGSLEKKTEKILHLYRQSKKEVLAQKEQIQQLTQIIEKQKQTVQELEGKNKALRIVKFVTNPAENNGENTNDVKQKINELIREIDRCIAMLNK